MISISIVEDHEQYRHNLVKAIEQHKSFVIKGVYSSAEDAMKKLSIDSPDIAIVDIKLKSKSGIDLILETKEGLKNTQFLMCTGFQDDEKIFSALKAGASGYIIKGSSADEIRDALLELHDGGSPMSPFIARKVISHLHKSKQEPKADVLGLSKREIDVLTLLSKGLQYKEISEKLFISANTVKNHCKNIYKRLHVQNKVEALNKFKFFNYESTAYLS